MSPLAKVLSADPPPFALLRRSPGQVDVLIGEVSTPPTLADVPLGPEVLVVVPYRQIAERGFDTVDDGAPLIALRVTERATVALADVLGAVANRPIRLVDGHFDVSDEDYAATVRAIIDDEIGHGAGSNFVLKRSYVADIADYGPAAALTFFRRLCEREVGAHWTFVVHTGDRAFVGASPERHVSLRDGVAVMNPISGTYRYPPTGPTLAGMVDFLDDAKERDELRMVVDEELKMMARICRTSGRVVGPYLKEMARLAHTEYFIEGHTDRDPREILRETMFAPTVTGSPLESACRVIARYEPEGRGYYSGVAALIGHDEGGRPTMDSAIMIRTADIDAGGRMRIAVGATVVRHSDPASEVAETRAKAAGLLSALDAERPVLSEHPRVLAMLAGRNVGLSGFWLAGSPARAAVAGLAGVRVLVVDAEDTFTAMIAHQLGSLGLDVTVRRFDDPYKVDEYELVVMGPGPGDPRDTGHHRIAHLHSTISGLLERRRPFLAVCLSHQVLCGLLGLVLRRCEQSNQGRQREIDLFGATELVGFYNSFAAHSDEDKIDPADIGLVEISHDVDSGEVHALRGPFFASMQFHAESVLTEDGPRILAARIREVLGR
ncbi:2-Amino-2-deoxy-isochorismate synthase |uniref:anthranilate synthase family protein n=1 Tax=Alloactinosynnema sp. L-07 TaxID=1653480 RepID=UPI00065EF434|nr:chorismate-binding protein [Alloactinosynnema sp. L-07]CRK58741.1 2-Amino-2-deoxy-isochorismate synthase \